MRALGSRRGKAYLHRVLREAVQAGPLGKGKRFSGRRIGRGAGVGSVLESRDRYAAFRQRRVIIKSRIIKMQGKGLNAARVHLRYIQRDGVTREGEAGQLYDQDQDRADGKAFIERSAGDRHQFRFIVSAEDSENYEDLKPFVRRLMARMEDDLGTRLDWVAVDHFNTGYPHTHVTLAGRDDVGRDLVIARNYMSHGMRERASELITFDLGLRTDAEIELRLTREVDQERFTSLDRAILRDMDKDGVVRAARPGLSILTQTLRAGRLQKLKRLGLSEEPKPGVWRLANDVESRLRELGLRGDIIKTLHRDLADRGLICAPADCVVYDAFEPKARTLTGRLVTRGLSDEMRDRHYLVIDGADGFSHYVEVGTGTDVEVLPKDCIVSVSPKSSEPKEIDLRIAAIAGRHTGRYSIDIHLKDDPSATVEYAEAHIRRLESMRKVTGGVSRTVEGIWVIGADHLDQVRSYERHRSRLSPVNITLLSRLSLEGQVGADGATWLDSELVAKAPIPLRDGGFGRDAVRALERRRMWLMEQELASPEGAGVKFNPNLLAVLRRRELARAGAQLSEDLGLRFVPFETGRISGVYRRPVELVSGRFALLDNAKEFYLVPWRPVLDRALGREISGIARGASISWTIGRTRGLSRS